MRKLCYVTMPHGNHFNDYYKSIIKPLISDLGYEVVREKDMYAPGNVMDQVYENIIKSDIVIADVSNKDANVNYELGMAHILGKPTVIITKSMESLPYDYSHKKYVFYDTDGVKWQTDLKDKIIKSINAIEKGYTKEYIRSGMAINGIGRSQERKFNKFLSSLTSEFEGIRSGILEVQSDEKGNCKLTDKWEITARSSMTHIFYRYHTDKPGKINIEKIYNTDSGKNLDYIITEKTESSVTIYILFDRILKRNEVFRYTTEVYAENFLSNLFSEGRAELKYNVRDKMFFKEVKNIVKFPFDDKFKNLKVSYVHHPKVNFKGKELKPIVNNNSIIFNLEYISNKRFGSEITSRFILN